MKQDKTVKPRTFCFRRLHSEQAERMNAWVSFWKSPAIKAFCAWMHGVVSVTASGISLKNPLQKKRIFLLKNAQKGDGQHGAEGRLGSWTESRLAGGADGVGGGNGAAVREALAGKPLP